jgi:hypothetical protein
MLSTSYLLFIETYINSGRSFTYPGNGSFIAFLSLFSKKTRYICINLNKATLYKFLTYLIILYKPTI